MSGCARQARTYMGLAVNTARGAIAEDRLCGLAVSGQRLREVEDPAAHRGALDLVIGPDKFGGVAPMQRVGIVAILRRLRETVGRGRSHRILVVEEELDRYVEYPAQLPNSAGADAIGAALIFLYLLEGQSDRLAKFFLAQAQHIASQANAGADMDIDWIRPIGFAPAWSPRRTGNRHKIALAS
jgi:hypothetical protein